MNGFANGPTSAVTPSGDHNETGASAKGNTHKGYGSASDVNPWESPGFTRMYPWLIYNLDPIEIRSYAFGKGLITNSMRHQLETKEGDSRMKHNEYFLLTALRPGGRTSFESFVKLLESLGPNYDMKRKELERLLFPDTSTSKGSSDSSFAPNNTEREEERFPVNIGGADMCTAPAEGTRSPPAAALSPSAEYAPTNSPFHPGPGVAPRDNSLNSVSSLDSTASARHNPSLIHNNRRLAKGYDSDIILQSSGSLPQIQGGYQARFIEDFSESHKCPICLLVLREPVQTGCGHRYCRTCIVKVLSGKDPVCPVDRVPLGAVFPDKHCQREVGNFRVQCDYYEKCAWSGALNYLDDHLAKCPHVPVPCPNAPLGCKTRPLRSQQAAHLENECLFRQSRCRYCEESVPLADMDRHVATSCQESLIACEMEGCTVTFPRKDVEQHMLTACAEVNAPCPLGCGDEVKRRLLNGHVNSQDGMQRHIQVLFAKNIKLEKKVQEQDCELAAKNQAIRELQTEMLRLIARVEGVEQDMKEGHSQQSKDMAELQRNVESAVGGQSAAGDVSQRLGVVERRVGTLEVSAVATARETKERISSVDNAWKLSHDSIDLRLFEQEMTSYTGVLIWKFTNFKSHFEDAKAGTKTSHYSQPFYSSRHGYKACARLYLNGDGAGFDKYVSIFFVIMAGEHDSFLTWPFNRRVTLTLLDQSASRRDISETFMPDTRSSSFQIPNSGMNVASGCPCFANHKVVFGAPHQYLKNDTLFLRVKMDTTGLEH